MPPRKQSIQPPITIQELYPDLSPEKQEEAAYYLGRYIEVVLGIFERVQNLTDENKPPTMHMK